MTAAYDKKYARGEFLRGRSICRKCLQSLRPQAQIEVKPFFAGGVYVGKNTFGSQTCERSEAPRRAAFFKREPNEVGLFESLSKNTF